MWLLTSGPTREHLDDVRFLTNASSGRMGFALAQEARSRGHAVTILQGPVALSPPPGVHVLPVTSADEMLARGLEVLDRGPVDVILGVAAVCDFRPARRLTGKPGKSEVLRHIDLVENPDVLATLAAKKRARVHVGFALQVLRDDEDLKAATAVARSKLQRKGLDAIVLNGASAMEATGSRAFWVSADAPAAEEVGCGDKAEVAAAIVARIENLLARRP